MQLEVKSLEIAAKQSWRIQHLKPRERENPQPIQKKRRISPDKNQVLSNITAKRRATHFY